MSSDIVAHVALGANLGDRLATFRDAVRQLDRVDGIAVSALSRLYETAPVGGPLGQGPYFNAAVALRTGLAPEHLLDELQAIEAMHQRARTVAWGPRTLDLDLLLYGDSVIATPRLTVPHAMMRGRRFVLRPLADIAPGAVDPVTGDTVSTLLAALPPGDIEDVKAISRDWR